MHELHAGHTRAFLPSPGVNKDPVLYLYRMSSCLLILISKSYKRTRARRRVGGGRGFWRHLGGRLRGKRGAWRLRPGASGPHVAGALSPRPQETGVLTWEPETAAGPLEGDACAKLGNVAPRFLRARGRCERRVPRGRPVRTGPPASPSAAPKQFRWALRSQLSWEQAAGARAGAPEGGDSLGTGGAPPG